MFTYSQSQGRSMEMSYIDRRKLCAFSNARRNVERDSVVAIVNVKYGVEGTKRISLGRGIQFGNEKLSEEEWL
jgi:hypothetical protein